MDWVDGMELSGGLSGVTEGLILARGNPSSLPSLYCPIIVDVKSDRPSRDQKTPRIATSTRTKHL
jgi:hypothetical protein